MSAPRVRGQASIEYLLVLAVFFSFLAFILPSLGGVYAAGIFAMDARAAELFLWKAEAAAGELQNFGEGSSRGLEAEPLGKWEISARGREIFVAVESEELGKRKELSAEMPVEIIFSGGAKTMERKFKIALVKSSGKILAKFG
ncbi:MAG: hypothetical protein V1676_01740 [Candidatus Diapherotrites archaeon]